MNNRSTELLGSLQQFCFEKKKKSYAVGSLSTHNSNATPQKNMTSLNIIPETPEKKLQNSENVRVNAKQVCVIQ